MRVSSRFVFTCLVASTFSGTTVAAPVDDFLTRLDAWLAPTMASLNVVAPTEKTKSVALPATTATLSVPGAEIALGQSLTIDAITNDEDMLVAGTVTISDLDLEEEGVRLLADKLTLQRIALPPPGTTNAYLLAQMVGAVRLENVLVQSEQNIIQVDQISLGMGSQTGDIDAAPEHFQFTINLQGVEFNQASLLAMDLNDLPGLMPVLTGAKIDLRVALVWSVKSGTLDLSPVQLHVPGLGTYELGVQLGGLTEPLLASLGTAMAMQADGGQMDAAAQQALGIQLLSQLSFNIGMIKLTDAGMVDVIAAGFEAETGQGPDDFKLTIVDGLDDGLGAIGISDTFIETAATAAAAFVDQGGTLGLDVAPATPATLLELVALGQTPNLLVDRLGLTIVHLP